MDDQRSSLPDPRTSAGALRRYTRRSTHTELSPPYHEVFERIAVALDDISTALTAPAAQATRAPGPSSATPEGPQRG